MHALGHDEFLLRNCKSSQAESVVLRYPKATFRLLKCEEKDCRAHPWVLEKRAQTTTSGGWNDRNRAISKMFEITSASIESRWEDGTNASTRIRLLRARWIPLWRLMAESIAEHALGFFGFSNRIIDNALSQQTGTCSTSCRTKICQPQSPRRPPSGMEGSGGSTTGSSKQTLRTLPTWLFRLKTRERKIPMLISMTVCSAGLWRERSGVDDDHEEPLFSGASSHAELFEMPQCADNMTRAFS